MSAHFRMIRSRSIALNPAFICIFVSLAAITPFFLIGEERGKGCCGGTMPVTHDMVAHFNLMQSFSDGLKEGNLYPSWHAETNRGYGAPATIFYPPAIYYLTSMIHIFARSWLATIWIAYVVLMIGSGISFYALARSSLSTTAASVAMVAYLIAPYHLINHYQRGAIAECLGLVWLPLVILFAFDRRDSNLSRFVGLALSCGFFLLSHPPTAYQTALVFGAILVAADIWKRQWKHLAIAGLATVTGILIASAYLVPAFFEQRFIHAYDIARTWPYAESYVFDFASTRYNHYKDDFTIRLDYIWLLCSLQILTAAIWLVAFKIRTALLWITAGLISLFLMTKLSAPLNSLIPGLAIGVFSWRMLAIASLCVAMLTGCAYKAFENWGRQYPWLQRYPSLAISLAIVFSSLLFSIVYVGMPMYRAEAFKPDPAHSHFSLLPLTAFEDAVDAPPVRVISSKGEFSIIKWNSEQRVVRMNMPEPGTLSVRTYFFPGWTAIAKDRRLEIRPGIDGEILLDVPEGKYDLLLEFRPTKVRGVSRIITLASLIFVAALAAIAQTTRKRRHQSAILTT